MRAFLVLAILFFSQTVLGADDQIQGIFLNSISITPAKVTDTADIQDFQKSDTRILDVTGKCGAAEVKVFGASSELRGRIFMIYRRGENYGLSVSTQRKHKDFKEIFSAFNTLLCVESPLGTRILLARHCGGHGCPEEFDFRIIDPLTTDIYPKKDETYCGPQCASKILRNNIPIDLEASFH